MMKLGLAAALLATSTPVQAASPWADIARGDIDRMSVLIKDNHPGPVDPENPAYRQRLGVNYGAAMARAAAARSFFDYKRAVLSYTNAFRDGHTGLIFLVDALQYQWPGFTAVADDKGVFRVSEPDPDVSTSAGDEIVSCDGQSIDQLMRERTDPVYWNADIPHERNAHVGKLFAIEKGDDASMLKSCRVQTSKGARDVALSYRSLATDKADRLRVKHVYEGTPSLKKVGTMWVVRLPSFMFQTPPQVAQIRQVLAEMRLHASEIRRSKVLLDVRGNAGGSSSWAAEVASIIWGEPLVEHVESSFDWTHDWRASPANLKKIDDTLARFERDGLKNEATQYHRIRDAVVEAQREGKPLARLSLPPKAQGTPPKSLFKGRAYLLTDGICASACLNFSDVVRRMPGATQIGWPTSADTVYIDNSLVTLPSGLAMFGYSMKVYRNGVRGNSQWYDPQIPWPGGPVTDKTVAAWIAKLP